MVIIQSVVFAGSPSINANSLSINLDSGECYVLAGNNNVAANRNGFLGAHIVSNKPIVLNNGNMLGNIHPTSTSRDFGIDQSVPIERIGKKYIVIDGGGIAAMERPIIIAHYDNTDVFINGNPSSVTTLDQGDFYLVPNSYFNGFNHKNMYIETSKDVSYTRQ